ncbi:hypothetical protein [Bacillus sp. AFS041924]|uniref:hypothetical protein n=1 Tax=Bacillus sp. AFS041924 TaxID=2033503 RepID=UPI000BFBF2EA|nr:hypothetical protein [Bacillus sp. AFS041924]PGS53854.1 hypothetical protein COC46_06530 [Bacillus sp. AFS041924]
MKFEEVFPAFREGKIIKIWSHEKEDYNKYQLNSKTKEVKFFHNKTDRALQNAMFPMSMLLREDWEIEES